jgi:hypothetical protein
MPLNRSLVDADDSVDVLYGVLCALVMVLPEAVRETLPADVLQNNGYCHIAALHTLRLNTLCLCDLEEMGVLRGHARMIMFSLSCVLVVIHPLHPLPPHAMRPQPILPNPRVDM